MTQTAEVQAVRRLLKVGAAPTQTEGAGFEVARPFPSRTVPDELADPFLLLDELGPSVRERGAPGAPWHPHRGFDTVTYMKEGESAHQDSMGNSGVIRAGEVQWMRAGAGVLHDEGRDHPGGPLHGFQLWVNLPARLKMAPPRYQHLSAERFGWREYPSSFNRGTRVKVIAGALPCGSSPLELSLPVLLCDLEITAGGRAKIAIPGNMETAIVYVYEGEAKVFDGPRDEVGATVRWRDLAIFHEPAETERRDDVVTHVRIEAAAAASASSGGSRGGTAKALLLAGQKLREPIARYGPFVMNSEEELQQAVRDYREGKLASIKGTSESY